MKFDFSQVKHKFFERYETQEHFVWNMFFLLLNFFPPFLSVFNAFWLSVEDKFKNSKLIKIYTGILELLIVLVTKTTLFSMLYRLDSDNTCNLHMYIRWQSNSSIGGNFFLIPFLKTSLAKIGKFNDLSFANSQITDKLQ